jgi:hypothetical protein
LVVRERLRWSGCDTLTDWHRQNRSNATHHVRRRGEVTTGLRVSIIRYGRHKKKPELTITFAWAVEKWNVYRASSARPCLTASACLILLSDYVRSQKNDSARIVLYHHYLYILK